MRGYCETCTKEVTAVDLDPEDGIDDACPNCGDDVHPGVHIEDYYMGPDDDGEYDIDQWLLDNE